MIIHIPHASRKIDGLIELTREKENLDFLTDDYVKELFYNIPINVSAYIEFGYSRFVCDVERFKEKDIMDDFGQGVIYTVDIFGDPIKRNISDQNTYKLYDQHHLRLKKHVNKSLCYFDDIVIIDAHTFEPVNDDQPDICIGIDDYHTPYNLVSDLRGLFLKNELKVKVNDPFQGTIVPIEHYKKNKKVKSIMLEANKKSCRVNFDKIKEIIDKGLVMIDERYG